MGKTIKTHYSTRAHEKIVRWAGLEPARLNYARIHGVSTFHHHRYQPNINSMR